MKNSKPDDSMWSDDPTPEEALAKAVTRANMEEMRQWLDQGADVNGLGPWGTHPIIFCACREETLELLLDWGADINITGSTDAITALHFEAGGDAADPWWVKVLIDHGADPDARDKLGRTALFYAELSENTEVFDVLADNGANVNAQDNDGATPLHNAARFSRADCAAALLRNGADPNIRGMSGGSPLFGTMWDRKASVETARLLIQAGACVNTKDNDGSFPLWKAALFGHTEMVKLLVSSGADVNVERREGKTPLTVATDHGYPEIAEFLRANGAK